jgi:hypothetical protein
MIIPVTGGVYNDKGRIPMRTTSIRNWMEDADLDLEEAFSLYSYVLDELDHPLFKIRFDQDVMIIEAVWMDSKFLLKGKRDRKRILGILDRKYDGNEDIETMYYFHLAVDPNA